MSPTPLNESLDSPDVIPNIELTPIILQKNKYVSKWDILFDKKTTEWISFKPEVGLFVYPCYSCRDLFSSKSSFQDHTNRRLVLFYYSCPNCHETLMFYNRCSLLLHARSHFNLDHGSIDLSKIDIYILPFGMAGFLPYPGIKRLYADDDDRLGKTFYINSFFYIPVENDRGKQIITLKSTNLTFYQNKDNTQCYLALRQLSSNIPCCQFVTLEDQKQYIDKLVPLRIDNVSVKEEPENEVIIEEISINLPEQAVDKENTEILDLGPKCPECKKQQKESMKTHFLGNNIPFDESWKCQVCRYIAATECSFSAHQRIHLKEPPFVCPECGKEFESHGELLEHIDEVCFHLSKHVKFRCVGKRCGKLFASQITYLAHFGQHLQMHVQCTVCKEIFKTYELYREHVTNCSLFSKSVEIYKCSTLKCDSNYLLETNIQKHIEYHCYDRSRCMYVFICRYCRNYFRSTATYAAHLIKCPKNQKVLQSKEKALNAMCKLCRSKITYYPNDTAVICFYCKHLNKVNLPNQSSDDTNIDIYEEVNICILCNTEMSDDDVFTHPTICKYKEPTVVIDLLDDKYSKKYLEKLIPEYENTDDESTNENSFENESEPKESSMSDTRKSPVNSLKRKRKKIVPIRSKKSLAPTDAEEDCLVEEPMIFDGTYVCKHCNLKESDRLTFHQHILEHRDISTSYQCMECGECFVVKPSLIKHLKYFHKIEDTDSYLSSNECYDRTAVEELKEVVMNLAPGEIPQPVKENQCRVCFYQCTDDVSLQKHLRNHGMAFLRTNNVPLK